MPTTSIERVRIVVTAKIKRFVFRIPLLAGPDRVTESNQRQLEQAKQRQRQDELDRIPIEGKFGQGKRHFSLDRIKAQLAETSEAMIIMFFMVYGDESGENPLQYSFVCSWCLLAESRNVTQNWPP